MNEETIFDMVDATEEVSIFTPQGKKNDMAIEELRKIFKAQREHKEATFLDNWKAEYREAQGFAAKAAVLNKRDAAMEAQQEKQQAEQSSREQEKVDAIAALPRYQRNKAFYEALKQSDPVTFFSPAITKLRISDKQALGLQFHLKG